MPHDATAQCTAVSRKFDMRYLLSLPHNPHGPLIPARTSGHSFQTAPSDTLIHHDGYVTEDPEKVRKKRERNMTLLREKLEQNPEASIRIKKELGNQSSAS